jgi:hypothetical protein
VDNNPHPLKAALKILRKAADQEAVKDLEATLDGLIAALAKDLERAEAPADRDTRIADCACYPHLRQMYCAPVNLMSGQC